MSIFPISVRIQENDVEASVNRIKGQLTDIQNCAQQTEKSLDSALNPSTTSSTARQNETAARKSSIQEVQEASAMVMSSLNALSMATPSINLGINETEIMSQIAAIGTSLDSLTSNNRQITLELSSSGLNTELQNLKDRISTLGSVRIDQTSLLEQLQGIETRLK